MRIDDIGQKYLASGVAAVSVNRVLLLLKKINSIELWYFAYLLSSRYEFSIDISP